MKKLLWSVFSLVFLVMTCAATVYALGETGKTLTYKVLHDTAAGPLTTYVSYSIASQEENGYWLQRTTSMKPDSQPLSITQTLLDDYTHEPLRYIMHRPAQMNRPESVIDLPLSKMGKDEILPTPLIETLSEPITLRLEAGTFETQKGQKEGVILWLSLEIPVMGIARVETQESSMELIRITDTAGDLLSKKPPPGGVVYLQE
jgi:hypothetical protein